jgi:aminopeptidase N
MTGRNRQLAPRLADIVGFFARTVGEAPYPDLTIAAIDDELPGGHSPAYFAIWHQILPTTPYSWSDDPVAFNNVPFFFLAHEVAHQWWGQAVGWKNYHEQWLSEGFAQYFALLYSATDRDRGPEIERQLISQMRSSAMSTTNQGPIFLGYRLGHIQSDGRIFRALVYNKSASVLHMLRLLIGDEAFFSSVRRFYREWRFRRAGTDDFRAVVETETPMRLGRFFDRWIKGSTLPRLRIRTTIAANGTSAGVRVEQIGDVFDAPVVIVIQYDDGSTEDVLLAVTDAVVERQIPLRRPVKRIAPREEVTLAEFVK